MILFQHEGQNFIGFQCETEEEKTIVCEWLRGKMGKLAHINGCSDPDGGVKIAISFHPLGEQDYKPQ